MNMSSSIMINNNNNNSFIPKIQSKCVQETLGPLIQQITILVNCMNNNNISSSNSSSNDGKYNSNNSNNRVKGKSKRAQFIIEAFEEATNEFMRQGNEICKQMSVMDNVDEMRDELLNALNDVKQTSDCMTKSVQEYLYDPLSSSSSTSTSASALSCSKRTHMLQMAKEQLSSIAKLLALVDLIDSNQLTILIARVQQSLNSLKKSTNQDELIHLYKQYGTCLSELIDKSSKRQFDLNDIKLKDEMACARALLKKNSLMLFTSSKTLLRHPELKQAQALNDFILNEIESSLNTLNAINTHKLTSQQVNKCLFDESASLATALDEFDRQILTFNLSNTNTNFTNTNGSGGGGGGVPIIMTNAELHTAKRIKMESQLEEIISAVALMADSNSTRQLRRDRIVDECNALRQALQDLLSKQNVDKTQQEMTKLTRNLRRHLRKAIIDHISDTFLETSLPLKLMIEAARGGDEFKFDENAKIFQDHAEKLIEVSSMACSMSNTYEGIRLVRMSALQVQQLTPHVINAAKILCSRTQSKVASENMDVFGDAWEKSVSVLIECVDDIINIHDYLSVSETHVLEDINRCVIALRDNDLDCLDSTAGAIRCRIKRVCTLVTCEMDNYETCEFTLRVMETVKALSDKIMPNFAQSVEYTINALNTINNTNNNINNSTNKLTCLSTLDENVFIDASRLVYDGIRDVRNAILLIKEDDDLDKYDDSDIDSTIDQENEYNYDVYSHNNGNYNDQSNFKLHMNDSKQQQRDQREREHEREQRQQHQQQREQQQLKDFANLAPEERTQIQRHWDNFKQEKKNFDREVLKWDDKGNDIIALAKQMCIIMMEMTDFTRGRGPLKTTMDIINAAKKISECGVKLDRLAKNIADECPESQSKRDLLAYLEQIPLFCNQLNIASKVKENVIDVSGEPILTGLDSATSLIISGKNLMNAVVSVVKASYVASTKYTSKTSNKKPIVQWRMKAPEKKPLILTHANKLQEQQAKVKKSAQKKKVEPIRELNEFDQ